MLMAGLQPLRLAGYPALATAYRGVHQFIRQHASDEHGTIPVHENIAHFAQCVMIGATL